MNGGPSAASLVEELVALMQNEKDCIVTNVDEAIEQWSVLARIIGASENKEYLDLFSKLDWLQFISRLLEGALNFSTAEDDDFLEESITKVLQAFERLKIDYEKLVSSGILVAVGSLLGHKSTLIQQRARALVECWKMMMDGDAAKLHFKIAGISSGGMMEVGGEPTGSVLEFSVVQNPQSMPDNVNSQFSAKDGTSTVHSEQLVSNSANAGESQGPDDQVLKLMTSDDTNFRDVSSDTLTSHNNLHSDTFLPQRILEDKKTSQDGDCGVDEGKPEMLKVGCFADYIIQRNEDQAFADGLGKMETLVVNTCQPDKCPKADTEDTLKSIVKPSGRTYADDNNNLTVESASIGGDTHGLIGNLSSGMEDNEVLRSSTSTSECKSLERHEDCQTSSSQDSHGCDRILEKLDDVETSYSRMKDIRPLQRGYAKIDQHHYMNAHNFPISTGDHPSLIRKVSDMDLEYCMVDALEIARLVANEVEREVEDYDERSGSSCAVRIFRDAARRPERLDSMDQKEDSTSEGAVEEMPTEESISAEALSKGDEDAMTSIVPDAGQEQQDSDSSQATEAARTEMNPIKGLSELDLNQDVCFEDHQEEVCFGDNPVEVCSEDNQVAVNRISSPVAGPSSQVVTSPQMPERPSVFEGASESKASIDSGIQPSSASRSYDGVSAPSFVGTSSASNLKPGFIFIDLNVAEGEDDEVEELERERKTLTSPGVDNRKYFAEKNSMKTELLDLNQTSEDENVAPYGEGEVKLFGIQCGQHRLSPASTRSSMKPIAWGLNLNDSPASSGDQLEQQHFGEMPLQNRNADGVLYDDSDIRIMGIRVGKIMSSANSLSLPFGREGHHLSSSPDVPNMESVNYGHHRLFSSPGYFMSNMYGPSSSIPWLFDSRGPPIDPQIMNPTTIPPPYSESSFARNMMGFTPTFHGSGPLDTSINMNSGYLMNGANQDPGVSWPLFTSGLFRPPEEQLTVNLLSSYAGKRKEPDGGFDPYSSDYRNKKLDGPCLSSDEMGILPPHGIKPLGGVHAIDSYDYGRV